MSAKIKIGITHCGYPEKRNFIDLPYTRVVPSRCNDVFRIYNHAMYKLFNKVHYFSKHLYCDFGLNRVDVNHFFNGVSLTNRPWFTTFESSLPRSLGDGFWHRKGFQRLAHESCRRIFAISECTKKIQEALVVRECPALAERILNKIDVLHPPQRIITPNPHFKMNVNRPLNFVFVGSEFFIKGGGEILRVFDKLIHNSSNIHLTIISAMQTGDHATKSTASDAKEAMRLINKNPENIQYYHRLKNDEVLNILKSADVALLPSWADTYGYFVLEAQACGCPVITTNVRALPEINNDQCGWVLEVPKDEDGNGQWRSTEQRKILASTIESSLERTILSILQNPLVIAEKSKQAIARIREKHDPARNACILEDHYLKALD